MATTTAAGPRHVAAPQPIASPVRVESPAPSQREYHFDVPAEFPIFGRWREPFVHLAAEGNARSLAAWLAANEARGETEESLWSRCIESNSEAFNTLRAMDLFDSSLDLPRGTVVFHTVEAPDWIKDDPPGEILDRLAAVRERYPEARIWLHEPVYRRPAGEDAPTLLTSEALHDEAESAKQAVWDEYKKTRLRFRAEFHARRAVEWLRGVWRLYQRRSAVRRKAWEIKTSNLMRDQLEGVFDCVLEARALGMEAEADFMFLVAYGPEKMSPQAIARAKKYYHSTSIWDNAYDAFQAIEQNHDAIDAVTGLMMVAVPVAVVLSIPILVPSMVVIDPILTFTLPEDSGRHWFIGHWDWKPSPDGTKTLIYV